MAAFQEAAARLAQQRAEEVSYHGCCMGVQFHTKGYKAPHGITRLIVYCMLLSVEDCVTNVIMCCAKALHSTAQHSTAQPPSVAAWRCCPATPDGQWHSPLL
jgi:hypothetical protein